MFGRDSPVLLAGVSVRRVSVGGVTVSRGNSAQSLGQQTGEVVSPWRTRTFRELNRPLALVLGEKTAKALALLNLVTVADLLHHLPRRYLVGTETSDLSEVLPGETVAVVARVQRMEIQGSPQRLRLEVVLADDKGQRLNATFFGRKPLIMYWQKELGQGVKGIFVGKIGVFRDQLQIAHPDFVMLDEGGTIVARLNPERRMMVTQVNRSGLVGIYPATAKLPTWQIAECAQIVLDQLAGLEDPVPEHLRSREQLMGLLQAFTEIHRPNDYDVITRAQYRLKYDEALRLQLTMAYRRADAAHHAAPQITAVVGGLVDAFEARLPFRFTKGQREVAQEITDDLDRPIPMQRLLQGEVGSGKTVVALRAMLATVDAGHQAALLAPTEVLAQQHFASIAGLLGDLGAGQVLGAPDHATDVVLLTGSTPAATRRTVLDRIADGSAGIVIGTHALIQTGVEFADLGLVVVDEQHRFGVEQRAALSAKASLQPHTLVMTATPIPRSVAMTVFGDLEVSTLKEIPAGRQDVRTTVVAQREHPAWVERAWQRIREEVADGRQAFVVCPRITSSEADTAAADAEGWLPSATVEDLIVKLIQGPLAGLRVEALHGRLPSDVKDATMGRFTRGEIDVLVSTTVIEVGVDVPNASAMVIMDADRFGISQLHQLRGRIGRGQHPGICLLISNAEQNSPAMQRLAAVAATRDGFELAELDLVQRREGNVLGASQAGTRSTLQLLRVLDDADIIDRARVAAAELVASDPGRDNPCLADMVTQVEQLAAADWMERT